MEKEKLLRVRGSGVKGREFTAGCVWVKTDEFGWMIDPKRCAPILRWLVAKKPAQVSYIMRLKKWQYEWLDGRQKR